MPPARNTRKSSGPAAKGTQKTISFANKVSKPSASDPNSKSKSLTPTTHDIKPEKDVGHITSEAAVAQQAAIELSRVVDKKERSAEEQKAEKVTDAQIKRYWRDREVERRAPRVHQEGLAVEEKILRLFDMSSQFGPAIGIARMKRWVRANKLGLKPPIEVLAVLLREEEKGNKGIERAHVDELMSSKFIVGEA